MLLYDQKRLYPHLYKPKTTPSLVTVSSFGFLMIDGEGDPNDRAYEEAVKVLFSLSYAIKMRMHSEDPAKNFVVAPLECIWNALEVENKKTWSWVAMISQPPWVGPQQLEQVREEVAFKKGLATKDAYFQQQDEGLCVTMLHLGSYEHEANSFSMMEEFSAKKGLQRVGTCHREIYLNNPKKTVDTDLKTVLRFCVEPI